MRLWLQTVFLYTKNCLAAAALFGGIYLQSGRGGIRTLGTLRFTRFPSERTRPLCDPSALEITFVKTNQFCRETRGNNREHTEYKGFTVFYQG